MTIQELRPVPDAVSGPHWAGLDRGELLFQRCLGCRHRWLPPSGECPRCLGSDYLWEASGGEGIILSWVVFHRAYDAAFEDRIPYNVALVELAEGPRMLTNVVDVEPDRLSVGARVKLRIQTEDGVALARFSPAASD